MTAKAIFFLAFLVLLHAMNWQAMGNMSSSNLTIIWNFIDTNFSSVKANKNILVDNSLQKFATAMSNYLNALWDPAWNVVLATYKVGINADTVLSGYAFREHWLWINGYAMDYGNFMSFIIWKDYNCFKWYIIDAMYWGDGISRSYSSSVYTEFIYKISNYTDLANQNDIWGTANGFMDFLLIRPLEEAKSTQ